MMAVDDMRPVCSESNMMDIKQEQSESEHKTCTIHSGHFMVSRVHDVKNEDDEEEVASPFSDDSKGFDFLSAIKQTSTTYTFSNESSQSVGIDASLTKLFECMTLAYSGKITSPRWKQFRGMHLTQKQRIRLNNLIWREWHMQYIYGKGPIVCQFAMPLSDHIHSKPEAVVLEGKYWKRQLDTVTAEYKKWRRYFKERIQQNHCINLQENRALSERELLERVKDVTFIPHKSGSYISSTDLNLLQADMMDMDFTNELFANLNQPFPFPNPRELSQLGCADLIQPGLVQLQPNLEEYMDIDSMQELFGSRIQSAFMTDSSPTFETSLGNIQGSDMSLDNFLISSSVSSNSAPADNARNLNTQTLASSVGSPQSLMIQLTSGGQYPLDPTTFILGGTLSQTSPQTFTIVPSIYDGLQNLVTTSMNNLAKPAPAPAAVSSTELLTQLLQQQSTDVLSSSKRLTQQQSPTVIQPAPSLNQQSRKHQISSQNQILPRSTSIPKNSQQTQPLVVQQTLPSRKVSKVNKQNKLLGPIDDITASTHNSVPPKSAAANNQKKKDGPFTVPTAKLVIAPRKNRVIAPAPPTTPPAPPQQSTTVQSPSQASYLAELLKNGTYPGALINVKKEPHMSQAGSSPIKTTTNLCQQARPNSSSVFSQHLPAPTMVAMATSSPFQTILPIPGASVVDASLIMNQGLDNVILSRGGTTLHQSSSSVIMELPVRFSHGVETKATSPVSFLPKSPVSSPPKAKRTPSPVSSLDSGSLMDPPSPFSPSLPLSPSSLVSLPDPDSPGSGESYPRENRRAAHLSAEQKRRCNLKTGFDMLQQLVPSLSQNPKVSKATMLQKTAEYCKRLKVERSQMQKEATILKQEIDSLNSAISNVQAQLPETGVPVTRQRKDQMKEMFDEYIRLRTTENSKFWIFSVIMNTLFDTYCNTVSTVSMDELCRTSLTWLDQSCSLVTLRPNVLNALRKLSTSTPILTEPQKMKEHALQAVARQARRHRNSTVMTK